MTDELQQALANRPADDFEQVAATWLQTEEFDLDDHDAEPLARFLDELAGLARDTLDRGDRLYCWICPDEISCFRHPPICRELAGALARPPSVRSCRWPARLIAAWQMPPPRRRL